MLYHMIWPAYHDENKLRVLVFATEVGSAYSHCQIILELRVNN